MLNPNMYGCASFDMMTKPIKRLGLTTMFYHYKYVHEQNNFIHKNLLENPNLKMRYVCDFTREQRFKNYNNIIDLGLRQGHSKSNQLIYDKVA